MSDTNLSFWEQRALTGHCSLCIVGGGLTGLATGIAYLEAHPAHRVVILEKHGPGRVASTRNAGFACFGSPSEIADDIGAMGVKRARELVLMRWRGLQQWRRWFSNEQTGYVPCGGYELLFPDDPLENDVMQLQDQIRSVLDPIAPDLFVFQDHTPFPGFQHAWYNRLEGKLDPMQLLESAKQKYISLGGKLYEYAEVTDVESNACRFSIACETVKMTFDRLVFTNNAYMSLWPDRLPEGETVLPARAQVLLTEPLKRDYNGVFHIDRGYYYFRTVDRRILLGGGRHLDFHSEETLKMGISATIQQALESLLFEKILGYRCEIQQRWSGIMAMGHHKYPLVKQLEDRIWCGVRMGGMGVALSAEIGKLLARELK